MHTRSTAPIRLLAIWAVLGLVLVACGATDDVGAPAPSAPATSSAPRATVGAAPDRTTVPPTDTTAAGRNTTSSSTSVAPDPTTDRPTPTRPDDGGSVPPGQHRGHLYFPVDGSARPVERFFEGPNVATAAMRGLLNGPNAFERQEGLGTAIPEHTTLNGIVIDDGLATVDLSHHFEAGGGTTHVLSRLAQVVYTLTQFPTVTEVDFEIDGRPLEELAAEGIDLRRPVDRSDFATIIPIRAAPSDPGSDVPLWDRDDLAGIDGDVGSSVATVVNLQPGDTLNVRRTPGVGGTIVGRLAAGTVLIKTGEEQAVGRSTWVRIETPIGAHWVNDHYLADS